MNMALTPKKEQIMEIFKTADAVCFDVDSTVIMEEGIDELAAFVGKKNEVAALTKQAMGGLMTFREALEMRLNIIRPTREQVHDMVCSQDAFTLTPGVFELIQRLYLRGVDVYLVSGGFRSLIKPVAEALSIPMSRVYANRLFFNNDGTYAGFDTSQPTSAAGGKPAVAQMLKQKRGYKKLVFIGDGATDLETCPPADGFIGFGGNVVRDSVKAKAKWYVHSFQELLDALRNSPIPVLSD